MGPSVLGRFEGLHRYVLGEYNASFMESVLRKRNQIDRALEDRFEEFFEEMADLIGGESAPPALNVGWSPITEDWAYRKKTPGQNRFYHGKTGRYRSTIRRKDPVKAYGKPKVFIEMGSSGVRLDTKVHRFRDARGRFTRAIDQGVRIWIEAFPNVRDEMHLISKAFSGRTARIMRGNEDFSDGVRDYGRPFLGPMYSYYLRYALPQTLIEEVTS